MKSNLVKKGTKKPQLPPSPPPTAIPDGELTKEERERLFRKLRKEWITDRVTPSITISSIFKEEK